MNGTMRRLSPFFWLTDVGFIIYWLVTFLEVLPKEYMYQDYTNANLVAWNLSFFPLDIFISITGFASLHAYHKGKKNWQQLALLSLVLTFCSGLQAIAFWAFKADFDWGWWIPNLYLLIYPLFFLPRFIGESNAG
ncbi:YvaD family protein [Brevibacillus reuszeri]|uniref:YvaD family protein n=1 Tax=Brevibacillus reuszeri TaxID=54915 RepID=UPI003D192060